MGGRACISSRFLSSTPSRLHSPLPTLTFRPMPLVTPVLSRLRTAIIPAMIAALVVCPPARAATAGDRAVDLYNEIGLEGTVDRDAFVAAVHSVERHGLAEGMLAIADMTRPSTEKRFVIIDLSTKRVLMHTWVAHGTGSGGLLATRFSNTEGTRATSLGLYRVGFEFRSPKRGPALILDGLDRGLNDHARSREVIMHGAEYVGADWIARYGRLGRSWGCPAVSFEDMGRVIDLLADGGLLYIYGG